MAHEIDKNSDGKARFAYAGHKVPWHRLGTSVRGLQSLDEMLEKSHTNYQVILTKVAAVDGSGKVMLDSDGNPLIIHDSRATVMVEQDGWTKPLATVGTRYEVRQNREVLERAIAVVGASNGDAVIDTCGALRGGARFFSTIDLGSIIIDPSGINDRIGRYLVVSSGHDGVWPIRYANTDIRAVCNNTVVLGIEQAHRVFTARHTRNVDFAIEDARTVLHLSTRWSERFKIEAEKLLSIKVPQNSSALDKIINAAYPQKTHETERQRRTREAIHNDIRFLYASEKNAAKYGFNGWSAYNAVIEYIDHYRESTPDERASASMDETSHATRKKLMTHDAVLSLL
jgi:phage/plasmid-like protein (TIGR03299 family)